MNLARIIVLYLSAGASVAQPVISPRGEVNVVQGDSLTLTCSYLNQPENPSDLCLWSVYRGTGWLGQVYLTNPLCTLLSGNTSLYGFTCLGNRTFTLTIISVQSSEIWKCEQQLNGRYQASNNVTVNMLVPILSVFFTNPAVDNSVSIVENTTRTFTCQTSGGIPAANITWYKTSGLSETAITLGVTSSENTSADKTVIVTSTLTYIAKRTDNTRKVFCRASNILGNIKKLTREILLNIEYPPLDSPGIQGVSGTEGYKMIRNSGTLQELTCSVTGGNPLAQLTWTCYNGNQTESTQDDTVTRRVTWTAGMNIDSVCRCTASHTSSTWSREASIAVTSLYSPSDIQCTVGSATLTSGTIRVMQGRTFYIACTSTAKPTAQYKWTLPNGLTYTNPSISVSGATGTYILSVWNTMVPSVGNAVNGTASTAFNLDILVQPSTPAFYYVNGAQQTVINTSQLKEIQGTSFTLICNATGNPQPTSSWSGGASNTWDITAVNNISNTCIARNTLNPTGYQSEPRQSETKLDVIVLTPPGVITCSVGTARFTTGPVYVIRGSTFSISCESTSYPPPYKYTWTLPSGSTESGSTFTMQNIQSVNNNIYRIEVNNSMVPTVGASRDGTYSSLLNVHLLYAPTIQPKIYTQGIDTPSVNNDSYISAVENDSFSVYYDIDNGNPNATTLGWTRKSTTSVISVSKVLSFNRIQRIAAGIYTFTASNLMMPTGHNEQKGEAMRTVYINVKYPAETMSFYANNVMDKTTITATNGDDLRIVCTTDSNPMSQIQLLLGGRSINETLNRQLDFNKANTSCEYDMGEYTCMAQNELNTVAVMRRLQYFVKCTPRLSPFVSTITNVTGRLHMPGIIPISVIAYPEPTFVWQKLNVSNWQTIADTSRVFIATSTNRLQSNVIITNVAQEDFGTYRAIVNNSEGGATFELIFQSSDEVSSEVSSPIAGIVGGVVGGTLCLIAAIVAVIVVFRKYRITCAFAVERKHTRTDKTCNLYETSTNRLDMTDHLYSGVQGLHTDNDTAHGTVVYENTSITPTADQYQLLGATGTRNR
ncbi:hemicentin-1-like isoform X2 [Dreissena polymorpha]|uniref:hemicentin-1-like isoform X2 n=1 Tax=Dreissena polymorpha TaxID=45954 RepID=UPI002263E897|nr:hemicentin-1-like isoform X2 [Dreissena polymorpha]